MNGMKIEWKHLVLPIKDCMKKNGVRAYINNDDAAILEHYWVFAKQTKTLLPEPLLSDFYDPSVGQKNVELLFVTVGTGLAAYSLYKYFK